MKFFANSEESDGEVKKSAYAEEDLDRFFGGSSWFLQGSTSSVIWNAGDVGESKGGQVLSPVRLLPCGEAGGQAGGQAGDVGDRTSWFSPCATGLASSVGVRSTL